MGRIKGGYVLQPRCFDGSDAAHFPPCTREVWFFLIRNVNHAQNGKFDRGSGFFKLEDVQNSLSWSVGYRTEKYSKPQITKALRRLREENMIATTKATRGVFVTVLNYDKYQDPSLYEGNNEGNTKETRRKHEGTHLKQEEKNEERNKVIVDETSTDLHQNAKQKNTSAKKFYPPSIEDVKAYCQKRENNVDHQKWFNFYEAKGWMIGKNKMRDWKAAVRTWEDRADSGAAPSGINKCKSCKYVKSIGCQDRDQTKREACTSWQQA